MGVCPRFCNPVPEEIGRAADLLERRWLLQVVYAAHDGATRFNEFRYALHDRIPPRTLAARLAELTEAGLLERRVSDAHPPRVEYVLTERGRRLDALLGALEVWAGARPSISRAASGRLR